MKEKEKGEKREGGGERKEKKGRRRGRKGGGGRDGGQERGRREGKWVVMVFLEHLLQPIHCVRFFLSYSTLGGVVPPQSHRGLPCLYYVIICWTPGPSGANPMALSWEFEIEDCEILTCLCWSLIHVKLRVGLPCLARVLTEQRILIYKERERKKKGGDWRLPEHPEERMVGIQALVRPNCASYFDQFESFLDPSNKSPFTSVSGGGYFSWPDDQYIISEPFIPLAKFYYLIERVTEAQSG